MAESENTQVILLLKAHFSRRRDGDAAPLPPGQYATFADWLEEKGWMPQDLLHSRDEILTAWQDEKGEKDKKDPKNKIDRDRLAALLDRGVALGMALEKWASAGIWILTTLDESYPQPFRDLLGSTLPPVLFGVGDARLLNKGGLAMVGSRSITPADERYTEFVARSATGEGWSVISGGARGVDELSVQTALSCEGTAVAILADGLLKAALSSKWRRPLQRRELCLASPFAPEASFQVGNAMARNKYVYAIADYAVVVRSEQEKGGTWAGATEALKKRLAPVFVNPDAKAEGNAALLELGALPLPLPGEDVDSASPWLSEAVEAGKAGDSDDRVFPMSTADSASESALESALEPALESTPEDSPEPKAAPKPKSPKQQKLF